MKQKKTVQYAYLAGVIDSDGCIAIKKAFRNTRIQAPNYSLGITINQVDGGSIDFLFGAFGGSVYKTKPYSGKRLDVYRWELKQDKAAYVLKRLIPFLRNKKKQAELGVRFMTIYRKQNPQIGYRSGNNPLTEKELEVRESIYQEMRDLKKQHKPSAAVETKWSNSSKKMRSDSPKTIPGGKLVM